MIQAASTQGNPGNAPGDLKSKTLNDLERLSDKVRSVSLNSSDRLLALHSAVKGGPLADAWAAADVYRMIDPDAIVERFRAQNIAGRGMGALEIIRNMLILVPIAITWLGISVASQWYKGVGQTQLQKPFLYLWENGFNAPDFPSFFLLDHLAIIDFILLVAILVLTFFIIGRVQWYNNKRDKEAEALREDLADVLAKASLCLIMDARQQPGNFNQQANQFLKEIQDEKKRLEDLNNRRKEEFEFLRQFAAQMQTVADTIHRATLNVQSTGQQLGSRIEATGQGLSAKFEEVGQRLDTRIGNLMGPITDIPKHQQELVQAARVIDGDLRTATGRIEQLVTDQQAWGKSLKEAIEEVLDGLTKTQGMAASIAASTQRQGEFLKNMGEVQESQKQLIGWLTDAAKGLHFSLNEMRMAGIEMRKASVDMKSFSDHVQGLPNALRTTLFDHMHVYVEAGRSLNEGGKLLQTSTQNLEMVTAALASAVQGRQDGAAMHAMSPRGFAAPGGNAVPDMRYAADLANPRVNMPSPNNPAFPSQPTPGPMGNAPRYGADLPNPRANMPSPNNPGFPPAPPPTPMGNAPRYTAGPVSPAGNLLAPASPGFPPPAPPTPGRPAPPTPPPGSLGALPKNPNSIGEDDDDHLDTGRTSKRPPQN